MTIAERVTSVPWASVDAVLGEYGVGRLGRILTPKECAALSALYHEGAPFRSRVVIARHGFGNGEYKYFAYPLPEIVGRLRKAVYPHAARTANRWAEKLGTAHHYPGARSVMLARCHAAGQVRPTRQLLKYGPGDFSRLHQDLYGEQVFPLQFVVHLCDPASFDGGKFVLTEQRPRMRSRAEVVTPSPGRGGAFRNERATAQG